MPMDILKNRRGRILLYLSPVLVLGGIGIFAAGTIGDLDRQAMSLSVTGQESIRLLGELGKGLKEGDRGRIAASFADEYRAEAEGDWVERPVSERDGVAVHEWREEATRPFGRDDAVARFEGLLDGVESLELAKLKLAAVEETPPSGAEPGPGERAVVRSVLWLRGERDGGTAFESQARLRLHLVRAADGWKVSGQELLSGRTVTGARRGFTEVAAAAGIDHLARHNPLFDTPEWKPERFGIIRYGTAGVSAGDYDGDGWDDLFFADGAAARLYRNQRDGTFEDVTAAAGLPTAQPGVNTGLFADLDNDGDRDLLMTGFTQGSRLYRNDGDGTFTDVTDRTDLGRGFVTVAAAGDYDGDGLLDLYLGRYLDPRTKLPTTLFYTRNGEGNSLLRNLGDLRFQDVTEEAGVREGGLTLGVSWGDVDSDGHQDLYVANDFGRNALLLNRGDGTFEDASARSDAIDFGYGMSSSLQDADGDGDLDLYVSNVHSGQRWYGQAPSLYRYLLNSVQQGTIWEDFPVYRELHGHVGDDWKRYGDRVVKGNSLLLNDGSGNFTDVSETAGANPFGWYWGAAFLDYDNDGRQDVYAANGWITAKSHDDL